jgi:predicted RecA/RadA family phage recombinase
MGHKISDGKAYVAVATAAHSVGDPVEEDGVFGFADTDAEIGDSFSISIGQEEREVLYPGDAAAWAVGDPVYWDGSAFTQTSTSNRFVGIVTKGAPITVGGVGWMLVAPQAFGDPVAQA